MNLGDCIICIVLYSVMDIYLDVRRDTLKVGNHPSKNDMLHFWILQTQVTQFITINLWSDFAKLAKTSNDQNCFNKDSQGGYREHDDYSRRRLVSWKLTQLLTRIHHELFTAFLHHTSIAVTRFHTWTIAFIWVTLLCYFVMNPALDWMPYYSVGTFYYSVDWPWLSLILFRWGGRICCAEKCIHYNSLYDYHVITMIEWVPDDIHNVVIIHAWCFHGQAFCL